MQAARPVERSSVERSSVLPQDGGGLVGPRAIRQSRASSPLELQARAPSVRRLRVSSCQPSRTTDRHRVARSAAFLRRRAMLGRRTILLTVGRPSQARGFFPSKPVIPPSQGVRASQTESQPCCVSQPSQLLLLWPSDRCRRIMHRQPVAQAPLKSKRPNPSLDMSPSMLPSRIQSDRMPRGTEFPVFPSKPISSLRRSLSLLLCSHCDFRTPLIQFLGSLLPVCPVPDLRMITYAQQYNILAQSCLP